MAKERGSNKRIWKAKPIKKENNQRQDKEKSKPSFGEATN
jgi:hypothetical protein